MAALAVAIGLTGCDGQAGPVTIEVDRPTAWADEPVHVRITGFRAGAEAVVTAEADDSDARVWRSHTVFSVGADGVVDLSRDAPKSGPYEGADGMGFLSYLEPPNGADPDETWYIVPGNGVAEVSIRVTVDGAEAARTTIRRVLLAEKVRVRDLTLDRDMVVGRLFLPPVGTVPRPGVLAIGGSGGGLGMPGMAALLASRGYPTLSVAYFGLPGLPDELTDIPLETFATAARLLAAEAQVDGPVAVFGYSRGTEAALLAAEYFPDLIRGVVLYAPSDRVYPGFPRDGTAWTRGGRPVPSGAIPVDHVRGPLLAIAGTEDGLWQAAQAAYEIQVRLDRTRSGRPHEALVYAGSGHTVGTFPYLPQGIASNHPITGQRLELGGTRVGDETARRAGWPRVLALLDSLDR
jgi:dienelactone hydrolase